MGDESNGNKNPDYQKLAQSAVDYVRSKMTVGALNKIPDVLRSGGGSVLCVIAERSVTDEVLTSHDVEYKLRYVAGAAESAGCGNCGEQSATAFVYLMDHGVRPIDWMALSKPGDHAFVVLGRLGSSDPGKPATWGAKAVVCDPWKGNVYPPSDLAKLWTYPPYLIYRKE